MNISFYDTSALLSLNHLVDDEGVPYISTYVFRELENIKSSSSKDNFIKKQARELTRQFVEGNLQYVTAMVDLLDIEDMMVQNSHDLPSNTDSMLICEALCLVYKKNYNVIFYTSDGCLYNLACLYRNKNSFNVVYVSQEDKRDELWRGWNRYYPTNKIMELLYTDKTTNILEAPLNEYCQIYEGDTLKDVLRWNGSEYKPLSYKTFKTDLGEKIAPRNLEQKMLFDLLQNDEIPVKLCLGVYGSGKSMLMLAHALNKIERGEYDRLVFIRNNIEVKDAGEIGLLPGEIENKIQPYLRPIADHIGEIALEDYLSQGIIEAAPLGFIRGRDIKNSIIFVDEAENLTRQHIQLLLGRCSKNTCLYIAGDLRQTDSITFERNSGLISLIERLKGNKNFGMVKLMRSERSEVAALADLLD